MNWKTKRGRKSLRWQHQSDHLFSCLRYRWTKGSLCLMMWILMKCLILPPHSVCVCWIQVATLAGRCTQAAPDLRPSIRVAVVQLMTLATSTQEWDVNSWNENPPTSIEVQWVGISDTNIKFSPFPDYNPLPFPQKGCCYWGFYYFIIICYDLHTASQLHKILNG